MDFEKYSKLHIEYKKYLSDESLRGATLKLPCITSIILIYTAVYKYSEEDSGGFWLSFFGDDFEFNHSRDVVPVMNCLKYMANKYGVLDNQRTYFAKKNMSEIFSQIYIPDISLKKLFSAIYSYYFRSSRGNRFFSSNEFLENNEHKLDKAGIFLLSEDNSISEIFHKIISLVEDGIRGYTRNDYGLPERFNITFQDWNENEKKKIDTKIEEYYISSPKIILDSINENIVLFLPKQKSRYYSDEECGWNITIDGKKSFVQGRIVRQNTGSYLIFEETINLSNFKTVLVEYVFNNNSEGTWKFENRDQFILFDNKGNFTASKSTTREGLFIGLSDYRIEINNLVNEVFEIKGWDGYKFYQFDLTEFAYKNLNICPYLSIEVEDRPVVNRNEFKLLFEETGVWSLKSSTNIYKEFGNIDLMSPNIDTADLDVILLETDTDTDFSKEISMLNVSWKTARINIEKSLKSGIYNIVVKYRNKIVFREAFIIDRKTVVLNNYKYSYKPVDRESNYTVLLDPDAELISFDVDTRMQRQGIKHIIQGRNTSVIKFLYKKGRSEIIVQKIIRPVKIEILGLDDMIDIKETDRKIEITKELFSKKDIRLQVRNLDNRYENLKYCLKFNIPGNIDINTDLESKNISFGNESSWMISQYKDRFVDFSNVNIFIDILNLDNSLLASIPVLNIKQEITMIEFCKKTDKEKNKISLIWNESEKNKNRKISLYNVTNPLQEPFVTKLQDGARSMEIDLGSQNIGVYVAQVDFDVSGSLFEDVESQIRFFNRNNISNRFVNKTGIETDKVENDIAKIIWAVYKNNIDKVDDLERIDIKSAHTEQIYSAIIQMKYFADVQNGGIDICLNATYKLLNKLNFYLSKDELISKLLEMQHRFNDEDLYFLINAIMTCNKKYLNQDLTVNSLSEFNLISSFCSIKNGSGKIPKDLIGKCLETFDKELLMPDVIRNQQRVFEIIKREIDIVSGFWKWITSRKNEYLLKYEYSKARLFRMYENELDINTHRVAGNTFDDLVENILNNETPVSSRLPARWSSDLGVREDVYSEFIKLVSQDLMGDYCEILQAAFISVTKLHSYSEEEYFRLMMKYHLSERRDIFNRYRAMFKLIFI